VITESAPRN